MQQLPLFNEVEISLEKQTAHPVELNKSLKAKKTEQAEPIRNILHGSIVTLKYENKIRGVDLKQKKNQNKKKKSKWFRNSFTVVMIIDNKPINFKICQNGMMQVTGCKFDSQAEDCVKYIWYYIDIQNLILTIF